jgi:hypothetical protein
VTRLDAAEQRFTPQRRFDRAPQHDLLELIETVAGLLSEAREATASGPVSIAARADYLHAQPAHRRALATWSWAGDEDQIDVVHDALEHARSVLARRVR